MNSKMDQGNMLVKTEAVGNRRRSSALIHKARQMSLVLDTIHRRNNTSDDLQQGTPYIPRNTGEPVILEW